MSRPPSSLITQQSTDFFFSCTNLPTYPIPLPLVQQLAQDLLDLIATPMEAANAVLPTSSRYKIPSELPPYAIARLVLFCYKIKFINYGTGNSDNDLPAIYMEDGPNRGIYSTDEVEIKKALRNIHPNLRRNETKDVIDILSALAEHVPCNQDKNIIPVNNGLFNYRTKQLMPFTPELVYTTKSKVNYVDNPQNPHIRNLHDNTDWDVETWMRSLSDDPEIVDLLWQVVGAVIRPGESWHKAVLLYSEAGNNGKGTLCKLMRELCGKGTHVSLQISDFGKDFRLEGLITASAIITDENDVNGYIDSASNFKAVVTHDVIQINRKYKAAVPFRFTGLMVQCVNGIPRFKDKSNSLYRRFLAVPFAKCFTGQERRYIKDDYLERPEVLEYVLHKVLHMDYHELSEPAACKALLAEYKEYNDPVRQFVEEIFPQLVWDLLPFQFVFDLYISWFRKNSPSGQALGRNNFINDLLKVLPEYPEWQCKNKKDEYRSKGRMDKPEPLIVEYNLTDWRNPIYSGSDPKKIGLPALKKKYRGLVRVRTSSTGVMGLLTDDDDDDAA